MTDNHLITPEGFARLATIISQWEKKQVEKDSDDSPLTLEQARDSLVGAGYNLQLVEKALTERVDLNPYDIYHRRPKEISERIVSMLSRYISEIPEFHLECSLPSYYNDHFNSNRINQLKLQIQPHSFFVTVNPRYSDTIPQFSLKVEKKMWRKYSASISPRFAFFNIEADLGSYIPLEQFIKSIQEDNNPDTHKLRTIKLIYSLPEIIDTEISRRNKVLAEL